MIALHTMKVLYESQYYPLKLGKRVENVPEGLKQLLIENGLVSVEDEQKIEEPIVTKEEPKPKPKRKYTKKKKVIEPEIVDEEKVIEDIVTDREEEL